MSDNLILGEHNCLKRSQSPGDVYGFMWFSIEYFCFKMFAIPTKCNPCPRKKTTEYIMHINNFLFDHFKLCQRKPSWAHTRTPHLIYDFSILTCSLSGWHFYSHAVAVSLYLSLYRLFNLVNAYLVMRIIINANVTNISQKW